MRQDDQRWIDHIAQGGKVSEEDDLSSGYRAELTRLLVTLTDSELAGAAGFTDLINRAPNLPARIALARIISEKYGHAAAALDLLRKFGVSPVLYVASHAWAARLDRELDFGNLRTGSDRQLDGTMENGNGKPSPRRWARLSRLLAQLNHPLYR